VSIEDFDIIIGIDRRGVAHVLKHRTARVSDVEVEVTITATTVVTDTYTTPKKDTGLLGEPGVMLCSTAKRVAVGADDIRALLIEAVENDQWVKIDGTKVDGDSYTGRLVQPIFLSILLCRASGSTSCSGTLGLL